MSRYITHILPRRCDYQTDWEFYRAQNEYYEVYEKAMVRSQEQALPDMPLPQAGRGARHWYE